MHLRNIKSTINKWQQVHPGMKFTITSMKEITDLSQKFLNFYETDLSYSRFNHELDFRSETIQHSTTIHEFHIKIIK